MIASFGATRAEYKPRLFGFVRHDYDVYGMSRPEYNGDNWNPETGDGVYGLPETVRLYNARRIPLTYNLQWLWFNIFCEWGKGLPLDYLKQKFAGLLKNGRAYTDHATGANYILQPNSTKDPIGFNPIITGGNRVEILDNARIYRLGGYDLYKIRVLDVTKPIEPQLKYQVVGHATISTRALDDSGVDPFPQLDGRPVPVPYFSYGDNYIQVERIRLLTPFEKTNPYNPPR